MGEPATARGECKRGQSAGLELIDSRSSFPRNLRFSNGIHGSIDGVEMKTETENGVGKATEGRVAYGRLVSVVETERSDSSASCLSGTSEPREAGLFDWRDVAESLEDSAIELSSDGIVRRFNQNAVVTIGPLVVGDRFADWCERLELSIPADSERASVFDGAPFSHCLQTGKMAVHEFVGRPFQSVSKSHLRVVCVPRGTGLEDAGDEGLLVLIRVIGELSNGQPNAETVPFGAEECPYPVFEIDAKKRLHRSNSPAQAVFGKGPNSSDVSKLLAELDSEEIESCLERGTTLEREADLGDRVYRLTLSGQPALNRIRVWGQEITSFRESEATLKKAKARAEIATRVKSEFLANMSHEIRTPMNGILGMASFLMDSDLDEQQREFADTIHSSGESLLAIINDILDFSKLEAQRLHLENLEFELSRVIGDTMDLLARQGQVKGLEMLADVGGDVPNELIGDPVRLRQILNNLVGNAIKFTEAGEVTLSVERGNTTASGIELHFSVSDSGIGISEAKLKKLFRPFSQADSATTRKYGGTGLGLVISKNLVELMGGKMAVESTIGSGSHFRFTAKFGCRPKLRNESGVDNLSTGGPVLVIDDHAGSYRVLERRLREWAIESRRASCLGDGLSLLKEHDQNERRVRAVLLDSTLPDGMLLEAIEQIRDLGRAGSMPIIPLIGSDETVSKDRLGTLGVGTVLTKPVKDARLYDWLQRWDENNNPSGPEQGRGSSARNRQESRDGMSLPDPNLRVLVVEDNDVNRRVAREQLRRLGLHCETAENGAVALKKLERQSYDAILMDCQMPVLDGFRAASEIRASERERGVGEGRGIPIIAMTANAMDGDRERCLASGMSDYLSKPVRVDRLRAVLAGIKIGSRARSTDKSASDQQHEPSSAGFDELVGEVGHELALEILAAYAEDGVNAIEAIKKATREKDAKGILKRAHALKGASATCGGRAMVYTCLQLEELAKQGEFSQMADLVEELRRDLSRTCQLIEDFRKRSAENGF